MGKIIYLSLIVGLTLLSSCSNKNSIEVKHYGVLMDIMQKNDISAKGDLSELEGTEHLYALGALENLKGEITILDSKPKIARFDKALMIMDSSFNAKPTLLVYSVVKKWKSTDLPDSVTSIENLEGFLSELAKSNGIAEDQPFPFIVKGKVKSANWHVVNGAVPGKKHNETGVNGVIENQEVSILGFYSSHHHGIFTHHDSNVHMHIVTDDKRIAGHLDDLILGDMTILRIPE